jgi:[ribosomal protein S18]-alanine N-acetyltransferase
MDVEIVPMRPEDLGEVAAIERQSYRTPWPEQLFLEDLAREWAHIDLIRESGGAGQGRVIGYCNYWLVHDEVHLLNLATHPGYRRRGIGTRLMQHLLAVARAHACRYVTLEVRTSNTAAQALYQAHGFEAVGLRPRYYAEDGEDAIVMTLELT